ncbi:Vps51/Vps67-domain-containing protein [Hyaloscypha sp. PMI_1271]|nr:Vps51/Vps67-domain-containing protein [Hyaloscypha sp. PMI_1271]
MSTIASPRDTSVNGRRIPQISTPTTSSRPSLEQTRSTDGSPSRAPLPAPPKRNRAALREYYNLQSQPTGSPNPSASPKLADDSSSISSIHDSASDVLDSELDAPNFSAPQYTKHVLETQSLGELLRTYNGILTDIRALDAEKKALVYDNYSKLIAATDTIRRMRENMGPLNPMASTLDPAIARIYEMAEKVREEMRGQVEKGGVEGGDEEEREKESRREKMREVVIRVLGTPEKMRALVKEGKEEEARTIWEPALTLLERWKERGVGGPDVVDCIEDGEAAIRGEAPSERSWENVKESGESTSS